jgi:hypothetical protein
LRTRSREGREGACRAASGFLFASSRLRVKTTLSIRRAGGAVRRTEPRRLGASACIFLLLVASATAARGEDAIALFARGDYVAARSVLEPLGQAGDREAQLYLGLIYRDGRGVAADADTADLWFRLAAERGTLPAMVALGELGLAGRTSEALADPTLAAVDAAAWLTLALPLLPPGTDRQRVADELVALRATLGPGQAIEVGRRVGAVRDAAPTPQDWSALLPLARPFACRQIACDCTQAAAPAQCRRAEEALAADCVAAGKVRGACDRDAGPNAVPMAP